MRLSTVVLASGLFLLTACGVSQTVTSLVEGDHYEVTRDGVIWVNWSSIGGPPSRTEHAVEADPTTFEILRDDRFGRDANSVFCEGKPLDHADPSTFRVISTLQEGARAYVADARYVWADCDFIEGADGATFRALNGDYARDAITVYSWKWPIDGADPSSFRVLEENPEYARDNTGVWRGSLPIPTDRPDEFRIVGANYSTDGVAVFFGQDAVPGAHAPSFHIPGGYAIGRDRNTCWIGTQSTDCPN